MRNRTTRSRTVGIGAPAAVIGALAAVLTAAPAEARTPAPVERAAHGPNPAPAHRPVTTPAATPRATSASHTVVPGDTVAGIAHAHGLHTADVLRWNGLGWRSVIYPGQKLRLSPGSAPAGVPAPAPRSVKTHVVVRGDTVYAIARKYGTSVTAIVAANGLRSASMIHPGQKLVVGNAPASKPAATSVPAASPAPTPAAAPKAHTVVAGDTLFAIARTYKTSVATLLSANGLGPGAIIYPGQTLRLTAPSSGQRRATLDAEQRANAVHIIRVGRELGVPDRGIAIALATAMVESSLRNLGHGDRDSLGLFQQRPSQGWGTPAQILDADRSIRVFYGGRHDPNGTTSRGLLDVAGWQGAAFTAAAQAVQISAYPDRYGQWEQQAYEWLATL